MKILPSPAESAETAQLVDTLFRATGLDEYGYIPETYAVHVHEATGAPDLGPEAIHVFPDGFDDPTVDIDDRDCGDGSITLFGGDVCCRVLCSGNWLGVVGTLTAKAIDGNSGTNTGIVANRIQADLVLEPGHSFECDIHAKVVCSLQGMIEDPADADQFSEDARDLFPDSFFTDRLNVTRLLEAVANGEAWRRE